MQKKEKNYPTYEDMLAIAISEAKKGLSEGGIPIGAAVFRLSDGKLLGRGHNRRVQDGNVILHGETSAFYNAGVKHGSKISAIPKIMVTTCAPCEYCCGLISLFNFQVVLVGDDTNFMSEDGYKMLAGKDNPPKIINLQNEECANLLSDYIEARPDVWHEDIGVEEEALSYQDD